MRRTLVELALDLAGSCRGTVCSEDSDRVPPPAGPKVSVIIPCYNLGEYLDEAVGSVLSQTYQGFEILVVDDGSTEPATRALLADYRRPDTRVIHAAYGGLAAARNLGIASAAGEYLCALDADDRLDPTYFEKAVPVLDADPSIGFVSCFRRSAMVGSGPSAAISPALL
jgi:glycosyltransferase involved in cell wall biosynthesis